MTVQGRPYAATLEVTYVGVQPLPEDARSALEEAIGLGTLAVRESAHRSVVTVHATIRDTNPLDAVTLLSERVDHALMTTGLLEEFDVSGKVLHVAPKDQSPLPE